LLSFQIIVRYEKVKHSRREQMTKSPPQMMVAEAITSGIERWQWGQVHEYRNGLMRPEITHYLLKITVELADILGIELAEGR
jgi:hypothetical protein